VQLAASPPATTSTRAFGKYDFIYARIWLGIKFAKCFTYVARRLRGFPQPVHQWSYLRSPGMRHE
jgi:hypothetical protein